MDKSWINLDDIPNQPYTKAVQLFRDHINPGLVSLLEIGEYTSLIPKYAEGPYIFGSDGRRVIDFVSSYGALNFGHNHPVIAGAVIKSIEAQRTDLSKELISPYPAFLAHNLALLTPNGLDQFYFCNSGTEAVEAALKLAARFFQGQRHQFVYASNSLHGKTIGSLSVTGGRKYRQYFPLLPGHEVPYGDAQAIDTLLQADARNPFPQIAAVILEPIQGEAGVIVPPEGYLSQVRTITQKYGVLFIVDEIQTGMGRAGYFLACQREGVTPDIIAMAKSLGGGICSIGATIYSQLVMQRAYPDPHDCLVQTSTFGGRSTACVAALAALEVLQNEALPERSRTLGDLFMRRLLELQDKYPQWIKEVRGQGLMIGIEFQESISDSANYLPLKIPGLRAVIKEHLPGMVAAALLKQFNILGTLMLNNQSVLRIYPPLTIQEDDLHYFVDSLDTLLAQGPKSLIKNRVNYAIRASGLNVIRSWAGAMLKR